MMFKSTVSFALFALVILVLATGGSASNNEIDDVDQLLEQANFLTKVASKSTGSVHQTVEAVDTQIETVDLVLEKALREKDDGFVDDLMDHAHYLNEVAYVQIEGADKGIEVIDKIVKDSHDRVEYAIVMVEELLDDDSNNKKLKRALKKLEDADDAIEAADDAVGDAENKIETAGGKIEDAGIEIQESINNGNDHDDIETADEAVEEAEEAVEKADVYVEAADHAIKYANRLIRQANTAVDNVGKGGKGGGMGMGMGRRALRNKDGRRPGSKY
jgi:tetratricopeptide (TPR) repeat protein